MPSRRRKALELRECPPHTAAKHAPVCDGIWGHGSQLSLGGTDVLCTTTRSPVPGEYEAGEPGSADHCATDAS
jgi:hypothetical protein